MESRTRQDLHQSDPEERCRLVLVTPRGGDWRDSVARVRQAFGAGDIASVILWQNGLAVDDFQEMCSLLVPEGQSAGIAMIVSGDSRIAGRTGADGIHLETRSELQRLSGRRDDLILGAGGAETRHDALEIGELRPDYILFGRLGHDTRPEPHPRNLALGAWWAELVEIPCIVLAGSHLDSVRTVAGTGAEFVAASSAIFDADTGPDEAVRIANGMLDDMAAGRRERR